MVNAMLIYTKETGPYILLSILSTSVLPMTCGGSKLLLIKYYICVSVSTSIQDTWALVCCLIKKIHCPKEVCVFSSMPTASLAIKDRKHHSTSISTNCTEGKSTTKQACSCLHTIPHCHCGICTYIPMLLFTLDSHLCRQDTVFLMCLEML